MNWNFPCHHVCDRIRKETTILLYNINDTWMAKLKLSKLLKIEIQVKLL
jgi:hypothetical protein